MIEQLIHEHLKDFSGRRILDMGPGYSEFSRYSARLIGATSITFLDMNQEIPAFHKERNRAEGVPAETVCGMIRVETIGALRGLFDLIHCQEVLEHIPDPESVLESLASKLTDRGKIIVTVPTAWSERWMRRVNRRYMRNEAAGHLWLVGTRTPTDAATGRVYGKGVRERIFRLTVGAVRSFFFATDDEFWSRMLPCNFFAKARRGSCANTR